ncbi:unnamed protein product [Schistosoma rodhaini]|nr:unnamed protein product [Schistosoma rodhaini]
MKFLKKGTDRRISECRIMRNLQPGRQQYRSLGYGFVAFSNHENALNVLHGLNNNPNAFPPSNRRPIVEFSVENMRALQLKQKRAEKCLMLQSKTTETSSSSSPSQLFTMNIDKKSKKAKSILSPKTCHRTISKKSRINNENNNKGKKLDLSKTKIHHKSLSILPKHFGPKNRHRHRKPSIISSKPKQKITRKQKRTTKRNTQM